VDVSMPVLDGLSATRAIRSIESARRSAHSRSASLPTTPDPALRDQLLQRAKILALTGLATPEDKKKAFSSGVDGYLIKPVSLKTLDAVFKSQCSRLLPSSTSTPKTDAPLRPPL
jgi:CheY-like chemotaxis protein